MKKRIIKAAAVFALAAAAGLAYAFVVHRLGMGVPCIFHIVTGLRCGGCGNTAAALSLLRLDLASALRANFFFPFEAAYALWVIARFAADYVRSGEKKLLPRPEIINVIFLVLLVGWMVLRNILGI